ncbi:hypothetical protein B0H17DRAFT_1102571 [Mycena rosella]|uniref:Uncharacterized protein n=1 Tax=Mycena rosella TaxID=1033263 RepID=A0AAD7BYF2_MYCRO|nr:hypothetical protein B0H17DRAFT_1122247 [Mycena rosella]KAJ7634041.1 hypothetical protein B0H17DRAFT_1107627 [Mycena rosella]KAJ7649238.1 hypothetical protein B0H17DRAFT_1102571 [Mycena rosella]
MASQALIQKQGREEQDAAPTGPTPKAPQDSPDLVPVPEPPRKRAPSSRHTSSRPCRGHWLC